jgi:alkyl sulfatase BDS1-like metallo-beta-lactamase superfamily hydrolase
MPKHFSGHPWLNEFYGSYKHSVRNIYTGYVGWFQGDAAELDPHPWKERAERYVTAMGGRDAVLAQAQSAIDAEDYRWAMDIITWAVRADTNDMESREIKAQSMRAWAYQQKNSTWRNWGLCQALELEDKLGEQLGASKMMPGQLVNYPVSGILNLLGVRLIAEKASDTHLTIGFISTDTGDSHGIELRRCVCQFHKKLPKSCDATLSFPRKFLIEWASGGVSFDEGIENGTVTYEGDRDAVNSFFEKFEPMDGTGAFGMSVR